MKSLPLIGISVTIVGVVGGMAAISLPAATALGFGLAVLGLGEHLRRESSVQARARRDDARQLEATVSLVSALRPRLPLPPMRDWAISPDFACLLFSEVLTRRPRLVLELGSGVSSVVIGYALERVGEGGRLVSIDHDPGYAAATEGTLRRHGLLEACSVRVASLGPTAIDGQEWHYYDRSVLDSLGVADILVVDGPPQAHQPRALVRYPALPLLLCHLTSNALVILDDADRIHEREVVADWKVRWPELEVTRIPTEKGAVLIERGRAGIGDLAL